MNGPVIVIVVFAALCSIMPAAAAAPTNAEFALRWNARDGGPQSGEAALAALHVRVPRASTFQVDYYDLPAATPVPAGFATILRRRVDASGDADLTWKLRGDRALPEWSCPFRNASKSKAEVDVTLGAGEAVLRNFSYSCTTEDAVAAASELSATRKACTAQVKRWARAGLKVEEWQLPGNVRLIEVSRAGVDTPTAIAAFRKDVASPLLAAGVVPAANSKTELGSNCQ